MKRSLLTWLVLMPSLALAFSACEQKTYDTPLFTSFSYVGNDARYAVPFDPNQQYLNPIISGCAPDPSVCRKGEDYYLANSSFAYYPGIPIYHSRDLVHWDFVGYALNRPEQLTLPDGLRLSAGIYAPDIKYNADNDTFYLIVTGVGCGGNFFVKTQDPAAGWSDPIAVPEVGGIDPSFLFDTDGKAYIVNNDGPAGEPEYDGHRAIWIREFDTKTDRVCGPASVLVDKGVKPEERPIWIEGPHLYHIGDTYYLMSAEGGTGDWHSEVIFSSKSPYGPFKPCPINPILTQRTLPKERAFPITSAGHADLVEDARGQWWAVFLACTTYEGDRYYNTGRSTFLLPVTWQQNQPVILPEGEVIPTVVDKADLQPDGVFRTGNGSYTADFTQEGQPDAGWFYLRTPMQPLYAATAEGLTLKLRPVALSDEKQPAMLCRWVKNETFEASTTVCFTPQSNRSFAGLVCFQSEHAYYALGKSLSADGKPAVKLLRSDKGGVTLIAEQVLPKSTNSQPLSLRFEVNGSQLQALYATKSGPYQKLGAAQDATVLSTAYAGGFTGAVVGLYASSTNE
jgi:alpha-N-arabinofuranosidase